MNGQLRYPRWDDSFTTIYGRNMNSVLILRLPFEQSIRKKGSEWLLNPLFADVQIALYLFGHALRCFQNLWRYPALLGLFQNL
jgi:hypothetical protein